jgi:hypothetical protein
VRDIGASIASGSFQSDGMIIAPCSMKTLASVAHGLSDNLIARAADVVLKERRRLVLMVRETPFNLAHLRNMTAVTEMGGIIFPPLPSFYHNPQTIAEMVDHTVARVIDLFGIEHALAPRWAGLKVLRRPTLSACRSKNCWRASIHGLLPPCGAGRCACASLQHAGRRSWAGRSSDLSAARHCCNCFSSDGSKRNSRKVSSVLLCLKSASEP